MKSNFYTQKCSISLRYLEQLQTKDQEHKADQSLMLEKDTQICQLEAEKHDLQNAHDYLRAEHNHYLAQYQVVVTDKNFLESDVQQLRKENNDLKDKEVKLTADNILLQAELQTVTKQVQVCSSLTVEAERQSVGC